MKKFILLFFFTISATAQIKGVVKDSITKEPIAYVSILVENKEIGTTSTLDGSFEINTKTDSNDVLLFSIIGYELKKVSIKNCKEIILSQKNILIEEVIIKNKKLKKKTITIGNATKSNIFFPFPSYPFLISKKFDYQQEFINTPFLNKIKIITTSSIENATFKLKIFKFDTIKKLPGESLINEEIIVTVKKSGKYINEIDVSKYRLEFPEDGIIVGIENIIDVNNLNSISYKNNENDRVFSDYYEPTICVNKTNNVSFIFDNFQWKKIEDVLKKKTNKTSNSFSFEPAINITLSN